MMRMLVAADGSPHAIAAAKLAARLGRELREAEVILVNVGHVPVIAMGGPGAGYFDLGSLEEGLRKAGQMILETTASAPEGMERPVSRVYRQGDAGGGVRKEAAEPKEVRSL